MVGTSIEVVNLGSNLTIIRRAVPCGNDDLAVAVAARIDRICPWTETQE